MFRAGELDDGPKTDAAVSETARHTIETEDTPLRLPADSGPGDARALGIPVLGPAVDGDFRISEVGHVLLVQLDAHDAGRESPTSPTFYPADERHEIPSDQGGGGEIPPRGGGGGDRGGGDNGDGPEPEGAGGDDESDLNAILQEAAAGLNRIARLTSADHVAEPGDREAIRESNNSLYLKFIGQLAITARLREENTGLRRERDELVQERAQLRESDADKTGRLAARDRIIEHQAERILNLQQDSLTDAMRIEGLADHLLHTEEGREAARLLEQNQAAIRLMDLHGLKLINDRLGYDLGDRFIAESGREVITLVDHIGRFSDRDRRAVDNVPEGQPDRRGDSPDRRVNARLPHDNIVRFGDEFVIVQYGIQPDEMERLTGQIEEPLSVRSAVGRAQQGETPFIASFGSAHLRDVTDEQKEAIRNSRAYANFPPSVINILAARRLADEQLKANKHLQYDQMRAMIETTLRNRGEEVGELPTDDRLTIGKFLDVCAPNWLEQWRPDR